MATLTQRSTSWILSWSDELGRHRKIIGKVGQLSERELKAILKAKEYELASRDKVLNLNTRGSDTVVFIREALENYLAYRQPRISPNTWRVEHNHLTSEFAACQNKLLTYLDEAWFDDWWRRHRRLKDSTRFSYMAILQRFMRWCKDRGYRVYERFEQVDKPKTPKGALPKFYTQAELQRLYEVSPPYWAAVWKLLANTGLRTGEAAQLTWQEVRQDGLHVFAPKTKTWRVVPINATAQESLALLRQHPVAGDKVIDTPSANALSCMGKYYSQKAGLKHGLHALRHTFASTLVANNVPLRVVQVLLGHSSIVMTEIYSHVRRPQVDQAVHDLQL